MEGSFFENTLYENEKITLRIYEVNLARLLKFLKIMLRDWIKRVVNRSFIGFNSIFFVYFSQGLVYRG